MSDNNGKWCRCTDIQYAEILSVAEDYRYPVASGAKQYQDFYRACWIISDGNQHSGKLNFFAPFCVEAKPEKEITVFAMKQILENKR